MNRNIDEREAASRATISDVAKNGCHHTGGGRMDDLRRFPKVGVSVAETATEIETGPV